jgi:uncharacterized membrane-anchored protein YhcB (DUF1043 family)
MKQMNKPVHNSISKTSITTHYSSDYAERMGESYRSLNAHRAAIKLKSAAKLLLDRAEAQPCRTLKRDEERGEASSEDCNRDYEGRSK